MKKNFKVHLIYLMVILTIILMVSKFYLINNNIRTDSKEASNTNFFYTDSLTFVANHLLKPNSFIGVMTESDCNTCYEVMLTRLNALNLDNTYNNNVYVVLINYTDKFRDFLVNRYRLQFPLVTTLFLPQNSLLKKLKTPYLIKTDHFGNIESILQIGISNINYVLRYFDKQRDKRF